MSYSEVAFRVQDVWTVKHVLAFALTITTGALFADHMSDHTIDERTAPVSKVNVAKPAAEKAAASGPRTAEAIVNTFCIACHGTGMPGAAKIGDKEAWAAKLEKGKDAVMVNAKSGIGVMPPYGTCMNCSDDELWSAIQYMANFEK